MERSLVTIAVITDERAMNCVTHRDWVAHGETMPRWICMSCFSEGDYEHFEERAMVGCAYCGGNCPYEPDDSEFLCDGFAGDIDDIYKEDA